MYIAAWDTFAEQAEALYRSDPIRTRYVLKYRHCDGKAVLKVTDDKTVSTVDLICAAPFCTESCLTVVTIIAGIAVQD